jgi:hypothetical protein
LGQRWRWTIVYWTTKIFQATPTKFPNGDCNFFQVVTTNFQLPTLWQPKVGDWNFLVAHFDDKRIRWLKNFEHIIKLTKEFWSLKKMVNVCHDGQFTNMFEWALTWWWTQIGHVMSCFTTLVVNISKPHVFHVIKGFDPNFLDNGNLRP